MARLTDAEMSAVYERLQGEPPEKTQEYMDTLDNEQKSQYFNFCMDEKRRRDKEKAKADEERRRKKEEKKAAARTRAEEERRAKLTPEERAKEDRNAKIGCGVIIALILAVGAWLFWPKSEEEIARDNQIKAEQQAAKQADAQKAAAEKAEQNNVEAGSGAPTFTKEIITANVNTAIPDAKNLTVSIARDNVFDVSFDLERPGMNEAQARSIAVKAIQDVIAANSGCQFEVIGVIVTSKMAPISMITFADGKYVSVVNGKREEFTP